MDLVPIAIIVGIGVVAYKFFKEFKGFGGLGESFKEGGIPAATGDIIYNLVYDGLRESATVPGGESYERAKSEISTILPGDTTPTPEQIVPRAIALDVSEDIISGGLGKAAALAPVTIGAGLGAVTQQQRYYETLPEDSQKKAIALEYKTRSKFMFEHPIESLIGAPAQVIHAVTRPADVYAPTPIEVVLNTVTFGLFNIGGSPTPTPKPMDRVTAKVEGIAARDPLFMETDPRRKKIFMGGR